MNGIATAARASRNATLVCVKAAGLMMMKSTLVPAGLLDAVDQRRSELLWKGQARSRRLAPAGEPPSSPQVSRSVVVRLARPSRFRLGPFEDQSDIRHGS